MDAKLLGEDVHEVNKLCSVGNFAPNWVIAMKKNDVKHIFFVAETMDLSAIERAKIDCAEKLFNSISTANVKYHKVATYQDLIDGMNAAGR